jgi:hypothetical protein
MGEGSERGEERREKGRDGQGGGEENDEWTPETQPAVAAEQARGGVDGGRWLRGRRRRTGYSGRSSGSGSRSTSGSSSSDNSVTVVLLQQVSCQIRACPVDQSSQVRSGRGQNRVRRGAVG